MVYKLALWNIPKNLVFAPTLLARCLFWAFSPLIRVSSNHIPFAENGPHNSDALNSSTFILIFTWIFPWIPIFEPASHTQMRTIWCWNIDLRKTGSWNLGFYVGIWDSSSSTMARIWVSWQLCQSPSLLLYRGLIKKGFPWMFPICDPSRDRKIDHFLVGFSDRIFQPITHQPSHQNWLVVYLPLWKIWVRQLGWWSSQVIWKNHPVMFQSPPSSHYIYIPSSKSLIPIDPLYIYIYIYSLSIPY